MNDKDFVPDYLDYSSDEHVQPEFTVVFDENLCETLVVGEGEDQQVFIVIHKQHTQRHTQKKVVWESQKD